MPLRAVAALPAPGTGELRPSSSSHSPGDAPPPPAGRFWGGFVIKKMFSCSSSQLLGCAERAPGEGWLVLAWAWGWLGLGLARIALFGFGLFWLRWLRFHLAWFGLVCLG